MHFSSNSSTYALFSYDELSAFLFKLRTEPSLSKYSKALLQIPSSKPDSNYEYSKPNIVERYISINYSFDVGKFINLYKS